VHLEFTPKSYELNSTALIINSTFLNIGVNGVMNCKGFEIADRVKWTEHMEK
jgi:hypothetical protein